MRVAGAMVKSFTTLFAPLAVTLTLLILACRALPGISVDFSYSENTFFKNVATRGGIAIVHTLGLQSHSSVFLHRPLIFSKNWLHEVESRSEARPLAAT